MFFDSRIYSHECNAAVLVTRSELVDFPHHFFDLYWLSLRDFQGYHALFFSSSQYLLRAAGPLDRGGNLILTRSELKATPSLAVFLYVYRS